MQQEKHLREPLISQEIRQDWKDSILQSLEGNPTGPTYSRDDVYKSHKIESQDSKYPEVQIYDTNQAASNFMDYEIRYFKEINKTCAQNTLPYIEVKRTAISGDKKKIFATISKQSETMQKKRIIELIPYADYRKLARIRVKSYIKLLLKLIEIDQDNFDEYKKKLLQVKKLYDMFSLRDECLWHDKSNVNIYQYLDSHIKNRDDLPEGEEKDEESDCELDDLMKEPSNYNRECESYHRILFTEELKWEKRADWLVQVLERIQNHDDLKKHHPILLANIEILEDLDLPVKFPTKKRDQSILYLQEFIQKKVALSEEQESQEPKYDDYQPEMQTQMDHSLKYPNQNKLSDEYMNDYSNPTFKCKINIRQKLCIKMQVAESDTNYILHVWKPTAFGNIKLFEKRINTRNKIIDVNNLQFIKDSNYIMLDMQMSYKTIYLVFNTEAPFKDPLLISPNGKFMGVSDHSLYCFEETSKTIFIYDLFSYTHTKRTLIDPLEVLRQQQEELEKAKRTALMFSEGDRTRKSIKKKDKAKDAVIKSKAKLMGFLKKNKVEEEPDAHAYKSQHSSIADESQVATPSVTPPPKPEDVIKQVNINYFFSPKRGIYLIKEEIKKSNEKYDLLTFSIQFEDDIELLEGDQFQFVSSDESTKPKIYLSESTNKVLVQHKVEQDWVNQIYEFDTATDNYKKSKIIKPMKEIQQEGGDQKIQAEIKVRPLQNDFLFQCNMTNPKQSYRYYLGETFITQTTYDQEPTEVKIFEEENSNLSITMYNNSQYFAQQNKVSMKLVHLDTTTDNKDAAWKEYSSNIFNVQFHCNWPYAFIIFNNEHVYMINIQDVEEENKIYYMNNFLGITEHYQPLTVLGSIHSGKYYLNVVTIRKEHTHKDFQLNIHQLISTKYYNRMYDITTYARKRIFSMNQEFLKKYNNGALELLFKDGVLPEMIKVYNHYNNITFAFFQDNNLLCKIKYVPLQTTINEEYKGYQLDQVLHPGNFGLMILQTPLFVKVGQFGDPHMQRYELYLDYEGDNSLKIIDVMVDTMDKDGVSLYIVHENVTSQRYWAPVNGSLNKFQLAEEVYNFSQRFSQQDGSGKIRYTAQTFEAQSPIMVNKILHYNETNFLNFNCKKKGDKDQLIGLYFWNPFCSSSLGKEFQITTASENGGKWVNLLKVYDQYYIATCPIMNLKRMTLANYYQFNHPAIPVHDNDNTYATFFTLIGNFTKRIDKHFTFKDQHTITYNRLKMMDPGLLIKYVNGQQQFISLRKFGYQFKEIIKYNQSRNGKFIVISGIMKRPPFLKNEDNEPFVNKHEKSQQEIKKEEDTEVKISFEEHKAFLQQNFKGQEMAGLYVFTLYSKQIILKGIYPYAERAFSPIYENNSEFIEPEIDEEQHGEYSTDYFQNESLASYQAGFDLDDFNERYKNEFENKVIELEKQEAPKNVQKKTTDDKSKETPDNQRATANPPDNQGPGSKKEKGGDDNDAEGKKKNELEGMQEKLKRLKDKNYITFNYKPQFRDFDIPYIQSIQEDSFKYDIEHNVNTRNIEKLTPYEECQKFQEKESEEKGKFNEDMKTKHKEKLLQERSKLLQQLKENKINAEQIKKYHWIEPPQPEASNEEQTEASNEENKEGTKEVRPVQISKSSFEKYLASEEQYDPYINIDFRAVELERSEQTFFGMHLDVSEHGQTVLIDRVTNTLYAFFLGETEHENDGGYLRIQFERDFPVSYVDFCDEYFVAASTDRIKVYKYIRTQSYLDNWVIEVGDMAKKQIKNDQGYYYPIYDSKASSEELINVKKISPLLDIEKYKRTIYDIKIRGELVFEFSSCDGVTGPINYFRITNFINNTEEMLINGKLILLSGDKRYIWILERNEIYDLKDKVLTLFLWPEKHVRMPYGCAGDAFNISKNKTALYTQGYVDFTYDIQCFLNEAREQFPYKEDGSFFNFDFNQMIYRFNDKSCMRFLIDESTWAKKFQYLLQMIEKKRSSENESTLLITNFFFSYFLEIPKSDNQDEQKKINEDCKHIQIKENGLNIFQTLFNMEDPRKDFIEEILKYAVKSESPFLIPMINSCFLNFLKSSSGTFQDYLKQITRQNVWMQNTEKFSIEFDESGFCIDSHNAVLLDDDFYLAFRQDKVAKADVEISYIDVGDLLTEQGFNLTDTLSEEKYLDIMSIPFIEYLILFQWQLVKNYIKKKLFFPFILQLLFFSIYSNVQIDYRNPAGELEPPLEPFNVNIPIKIVNIIMLLSVQIYFFNMEFHQFFKDPHEYFTSFWNLGDVIALLLCMSVIFQDLLGVHPSYMRAIASFCVIILWIKFFYFLRIFEQTATQIRMIIEIVNDMKNFLIVLVIAIVGFANGYYIMSQGDPNHFAGETLPLAILYSYRLALGDFSHDYFYEASFLDSIICWFIFIIATVFVVIVLLNLLIAIMGDSFSRVLENITNLSVREKVMLIAENEALIDRKLLFKKSRYLIVFKEKVIGSAATGTWDGQINIMKRQIMDSITAFRTAIENKMTENSKEWKKTSQINEESSKKKLEKIELEMQTQKKDLDTTLTVQQKDNQCLLSEIQKLLSTQNLSSVQTLQIVQSLQKRQETIERKLRKAIGPEADALDDEDA